MNTPPSVRFLASFERKRDSEIVYIWIGLLFGAIAVLLAFVRNAHDVAFYMYVFVGVAIFIGTIFYTFKKFSVPPEMFEVFDSGFAVRRGENSVFHPWSDVQTYTHKIVKVYQYMVIHTETKYDLLIQLKNGKKLVFNNSRYKQAADLADMLPRLLEKPMMTEAAQTLKAGQNLSFKQIAVSRTGIQNGKKFVAWSNIADIKLKKGTLSIYEARPNGKGNVKFISESFGELPNAFLLMNLVVRLAPTLRNQQVTAQFALD